MTILEYINDLNKEYKTGRATEHSYRGYLQNLIKTISTDVMVTNEPTRVKCGAPDYIITKKDIPVGYIEAKDIGYKLDDKQYKEQFDRYRKSLSNLIITDYIDFWLYIDGELVKKIRIAEITGGGIQPISENHNEFTNLIKDFCTHIGQTIKSSKKLAEMMAGKARMLSEVIEKALTEDEADIHNPDTALQGQLHAFKDILIHDIKPKEFADIYAQTIAYGMFAARLHDPTLPTFSRQEAAQLIPKTNPFLRKLFQYVAGYDLDQRLVWIVDGLADIFRATDVAAILKNFGKSTQTNDPIIHFYETFLSEYDPALRKARGVWYTPEPVVNFIVRAVDDILKTEFDLKDGLADTSKTKIKTKVVTKATSDLRSKMKEVEIEQEVHKVQILDPATGTGTFLAEVVKHIYKKFEGQQGIWSKYVDEHLVPRLNGFELLMASYAMAHLKLDMLLTETGYKQSKEQRFKIYLTNSLEEHHPDTGTLFANWLSEEANEANQIKRDTPVMCVIGNPPYFGFKSNEGKWITELTNSYKFVDGKDINEKKHRLGNDYVKFIRFGQYFIEKNQTGILAYINDHGFLFNPTFKGMRWNLMRAFDEIYIIDLHGNSKKKERNADGSKDENVFDIQQGVSINIFLKTGKKKNNTLGKVFHYDLLGLRESKYCFLNENEFKNIPFTEIRPDSPFYFFMPNKQSNVEEYESGFPLSHFFNSGVTGTVTGNDDILIASDELELNKRLSEKANSLIDKRYVKTIEYRPFDKKAMYFIETFNKNPYQEINVPASYRSRYSVMKHLVKPNNYALIVGRQGQVVGDMPWNIIFISDNIVDLNMFYRGGGVVSPLYLYPETNGQQTIESQTERTPNLNTEIVKLIADKLGLTFTNEKETTKNTFAPIDILDYIYAVLHSPTYREKYKEFLKIDFPRVPYPTDANKFWQLVKMGGELRQIHLLESDTVNRFITQYPIDGDNRVTKIRFEENYEIINGNTVTNADPVYPFGRVYINDKQFFQQVPKAAWEFYIGGYQPAQKWLKDRKERELSFEDILHYQKIIVALNETIRLMAEVDKIGVE